VFLEGRMVSTAPTAAVRIERLADQLRNLAFDMAEPSRSVERAERLIADAERIADEVRAVVRGRG
jgi:hypothetical protein